MSRMTRRRLLGSAASGAMASSLLGPNLTRALAGPPRALDGGAVYVTNANSDSVSVIDAATRRVTGTIGVGHIPTGITAQASRVWVANNTSGNVSVIDIATGAVTSILIALADEPTASALV